MKLEVAIKNKAKKTTSIMTTQTTHIFGNPGRYTVARIGSDVTSEI